MVSKREQRPFRIKRGDTLGFLQLTLGAPAIGEPETLEDATVRFLLKRVGDNQTAVVGTATVVDAAERIVRYEWQPGDTDVPGYYYAEFEVTYPATESEPERVRTYPTGPENRLMVVVEADLG